MNETQDCIDRLIELSYQRAKNANLLPPLSPAPNSTANILPSLSATEEERVQRIAWIGVFESVVVALLRKALDVQSPTTHTATLLTSLDLDSLSERSGVTRKEFEAIGQLVLHVLFTSFVFEQPRAFQYDGRTFLLQRTSTQDGLTVVAPPAP